MAKPKSKLGAQTTALIEALAEFDRDLAVLKQSIASMRDGPRKRQLIEQCKAIEGFGDVYIPVAPRANWSSSQWLTEAQHQKSAARKYRAAGRLDLAGKCEADGRRAQSKGDELRRAGQ